MASRIAEHVGRVLGDRYRLIRPVGTGASAHVYVAEDVTLRRRVAVKLLHPALAQDEAFLRRFQAEARVVAALRQPHILRVYDWGEDEGTPFLVMELLEGGSLRSMLDRGSLLSPAQAAVTGAEAAHALDYAHRRGLIHRDIKPANLLFDDEGRVCVADFGLARALAEATWTEPAGALLGTARYAAPELVQGAVLDGRADVYALALVLVEAVTGRVPFATDTTIGTLMARVDHPLVAPEELGPLGPILERAGTPDPADRLDAAGLARALDEVRPSLGPARPLDLAGPLTTGEMDAEGDPTELPGRPTLFDREADSSAAATGSRRRGGDGEPSGPGAGAVTVAGGAALGGGVVGGDRPAGAFAPDASTGQPQVGAEPAGGPPSPGRMADAGGRDRSRRGRRRGGTVDDRQAGHHWGRWILALVVVLAALAAGGVALARATRPTHPVPHLSGDTEAQAALALAPLHLHLRVAARPYDDASVAGIVLRQRPDAGRLREGSTVSVDVSAGPTPVQVPDLSALSQADAIQRLAGAELKVGQVSTRVDATVPAGVVIDWTGRGGQLPKGSPVDLVTSSGPPTVAVPDVHAQSFAAAQAALTAVGLTAVEDPEFNNTVAAGQVVGTVPAAKANAVVGTQVKVTVSKGPDLVTVPDVTGEAVLTATARMQAAGLAVIEVVGSPDRPVYVTNPPKGSRILRGSQIKLYTS